jgi:hypothetical protein
LQLKIRNNNNNNNNSKNNNNNGEILFNVKSVAQELHDLSPYQISHNSIGSTLITNKLKTKYVTTTSLIEPPFCRISLRRKLTQQKLDILPRSMTM